MGGLGEMVTGNRARAADKRARRAQRDQEARIAEQEARNDALETGLRGNQNRGAGLLAYVDDDQLADVIGQTSNSKVGRRRRLFGRTASTSSAG